jgi:hypothetical protein
MAAIEERRAQAMFEDLAWTKLIGKFVADKPALDWNSRIVLELLCLARSPCAASIEVTVVLSPSGA